MATESKLDFESEAWDRAGLREELLPRTLRYVTSRIPYYRQFADRIDESDPDLSIFPFVDSNLMSEQLESFVVLDRFPDATLMTGGTTGTPNLIFRNVDELEILYKHLFGLAPGEILPQDDIDSFAILASGMHHGSFLVAPHGHGQVSLPFSKLVHTSIVRRFIDHGLEIRGRRVPANRLVMPLRELKVLTCCLQLDGYDGKASPIAQLLPYGYHVTPTWASRLAEFWGATIRESYGFTEFNLGNMYSCQHCRGYHPPMQVIPEYVSPDRKRAAESGDAVLVLTSLFPFVQLQPRIRWWSHDIVRLKGFCEYEGEMGFDYIGREHTCCTVEEGDHFRTILGPCDVLRSFEETPGLLYDNTYFEYFASGAYGGNLATSDLPYPVGIPMFHIAIDGEVGCPRTVTLRLEMADEFSGSSGDAEKTATRLRERLFADVEPLCDDLYRQDVELEIRVLRAGGLAAEGLRPTVV